MRGTGRKSGGTSYPHTLGGAAHAFTEEYETRTNVSSSANGHYRSTHEMTFERTYLSTVTLDLQPASQKLSSFVGPMRTYSFDAYTYVVLEILYRAHYLGNVKALCDGDDDDNDD